MPKNTKETSLTKKQGLDVTAQLAAFAANLTYDDLPEEVRHRARMFVLDGLGVMLGAVTFAEQDEDYCLDHYLELAAPPGRGTIVGSRRRTNPMMAAFANGTRSEVLDCQDTNITARIHNGSAIIPAALAMGEELTSSGRDVMVAAVAGYEVGTRLGHAVQPSHWHSGFQMTGTFNTCAAAATVGRLMEFDTDKMAAALGISGFIMPISNGDNVFKGYNIKPIHGGQPAMCGLSAAYLARSGYRAGPLEGEPPRHHAALHILGCENPDLTEATRGFGKIWHSLEVGFKPYPVGLLIIGPVEAALALTAEKPITTDNIEAVEIKTYHEGLKFTGEKYTTTSSNYVDAHLSIPFCVATTLIDGEMTPRQLSRDRLADKAVHALARRITVVEDEDFSAMYPHEWPLNLQVRFKDGEVREKRIDQVNWSPRRPPPWDEITAKFTTMAEPVIGSSRTKDAIDFVGDLDKAPSVEYLLKLVRK